MAVSEETGRPAKAASILLVEDSMVQRLAIAALLEKHSYGVEVAADGAEALRILEASRNLADLVITDVGMPRMNGINLCRAIKQNPMTKHVPVIMLTSFDDERNHRTAVEVGAAEFVTKPVSEQELIFRVESTLASASDVATQAKPTWHQELFDAMADAVLVSDSRDRYLDANPAAAALLGYSREDLLRLDAKELTLQAPTWLDTVRLRVKDAGAWRGRLQMLHKSGQPVLVDTHMSFTAVDGDLVFVSVMRKVV